MTLRSTDAKLLCSDNGIIVLLSDGKLLVTIPRNVNGITLGIDVGKKLGSLGVSVDDSNIGNIEGLLIGDSMGSSHG